MKSLKKMFLLVVAVGLIFSFSMCKKDSTGELKMGATINGAAWESSLRVTTLQNGRLFIGGSSLTGEALVFFVNGKTAGTYNLAPLAGQLGTWAGYKSGLTVTSALQNDSSKYALATSGSVIITKIDTVAKLVSGTFNFVTKVKGSDAVKTVTNGEFNNLTIIKQ